MNLLIAENEDHVDLEVAIVKLKPGKAPRVDDIRLEMVKYMGNEGIKLVQKIIETAWSTEEIPSD